MTDFGKEKNNNEVGKNEEEVQIEKELDQEAVDVIFRLYDKTFKDLVER